MLGAIFETVFVRNFSMQFEAFDPDAPALTDGRRRECHRAVPVGPTTQQNRWFCTASMPFSIYNTCV